MLDIVGFVILFFNGNFTRSFNRLDGFTISSESHDGRGAMTAIESKRKLPKVLDYLGFSSILIGFILQLIGTVIGIWGAP